MKHVVSQLRRSSYIKEKRIYQLLGGPVDHGSDGLMDFFWAGRCLWLVTCSCFFGIGICAMPPSILVNLEEVH